MANTAKTTKQLKLVAGFEDGDNRTIIMDNPHDSITGADIDSLETKMLAGQYIIGDKTGAAFKQIISAVTVTQTTTNLDLTDTSDISSAGWNI